MLGISNISVPPRLFLDLLDERNGSMDAVLLLSMNCRSLSLHVADEVRFYDVFISYLFVS